jgi:hypothetical protein
LPTVTRPTTVPTPTPSFNPLDPTALPTFYPTAKPTPMVNLGYASQVIFDLTMDSSNYAILGSNLFSGIASVLSFNLSIDTSRIQVFRVRIKVTQKSSWLQTTALKEDPNLEDNNDNRLIPQSLYEFDSPKLHLSSSSRYEIKCVIANFSNYASAFSVASSATKYITSGFVDELTSYVGKNIDSVTNVQFSAQSTDITPEFSCNLNGVLKLLWT